MSSKNSTLNQTSIHDLKTYDLFQLTPFLTVGVCFTISYLSCFNIFSSQINKEPYVSNKDTSLKDDRARGRQLYTSPHKSGLMNESTFGPFLTLAVV